MNSSVVFSEVRSGTSSALSSGFRSASSLIRTLTCALIRALSRLGPLSDAVSGALFLGLWSRLGCVLGLDFDFYFGCGFGQVAAPDLGLARKAG